MEKEWRDLLYEFNGNKPISVLLNMIVVLLFYLIFNMKEKNILTKDDAIKMRENIRLVELEAYQKNY